MVPDWQRVSEKQRHLALLAGLLLGLSAISVGVFTAIRLPASTVAEGWVPVIEAPLVNTIGLVGKIQPQNVITLAAPFDGEILVALVEQGQRVEEGQLLLQMDSALIDIQLREALAAQLKARRVLGELQGWAQGKQVIRARRALRTADMALKRSQTRLRESQGLFEHGIIARDELDDQQQQVQLQQVDLAAATEELRQVLEQSDSELLNIAEMELANASVKHDALKRLLGKRDMLAPFAGVVLPAAVVAESGTAVSPVLQNGSIVNRGQALFRLADVAHLKVVSSVSELDVNLLREGQRVAVEGDGFDQALKGVVSAVSGLATPDDDPGNGAAFPITLLLDPPALLPVAAVRLGMTARLSVITYRNDQAVIVPVAAVRRDSGELTVRYRQSMNHPAQAIAVTTGHSTPEGVEVFGLGPGWVDVL